MAWLVPYVINGAAHSAALFRRQAQRPATDQVGVARPGDLKVTQLPAAATGFRIAQGGLSLPSRFPGRGRESYGVENGDAVIDIADVPGTGSSARRDAVVVELLDPNYMPITHEDAALTNYMTVHVVQGVAAGAKTIDNIPSFNNRTAYVLAFINWPANTTAITNAMIEDARKLANPQSLIVVRGYNVNSADGFPDDPVNQQYPAADTWPITARESGALIVDIPEWATHVNITMNVIDVEAAAGSTGRGRFWVMVGQESNADRILTQHGRWSHMTTTVSVADKQPIKPGLRGTTQHFFPRAARERGTVAESVKTTWSSSVSMLLEFTQEAV